MATLTAEELADIRDTTGADSTSEYSDAKIQVQYDLAAVDAPSSSLIFPYTYVYVLRRICGIRSIQVDRTTDHGDHETRSQKRDAAKLLLDYWEKMTNLAGGVGGTIQVGFIDLNTDYEQADFDAEFEVSDG